VVRSQVSFYLGLAGSEPRRYVWEVDPRQLTKNVTKHRLVGFYHNWLRITARPFSLHGV
jgi:hypothetical protein